MPDAYLDRYRKLSHQELYRQLTAGSPKQVDRVADSWHAGEEAIDAVVKGLRADLERLTSTWEGVAAREFHYRLNLVVTFAQRLADEAAAIQRGLGVMSRALTQTQRAAEPSPPPDTTIDQLDGVLGSALGHTVTAEERASSHERLVALVARLAADYALTAHGNWPAIVSAAPVDLPQLIGHAGYGDLRGVGPLTVPPGPPPTDPTVSGPTGVGGLAGAGGLTSGGAPPGTSLASISAQPPPAPTTLSGAPIGLSAAARQQLAPDRTADGRGAEGRTGAASPLGGAGPMPMVGATGGWSADGHSTNDPRVVGEDAGWAGEENVVWAPDDDAPPAVLSDPERPPA